MPRPRHRCGHARHSRRHPDGGGAWPSWASAPTRRAPRGAPSSTHGSSVDELLRRTCSSFQPSPSPSPCSASRSWVTACAMPSIRSSGGSNNLTLTDDDRQTAGSAVTDLPDSVDIVTEEGRRLARAARRHARAHRSAKLLEVRNLSTQFFTKEGVVHAVDEVSFELDYGETLGPGRRVRLRQERHRAVADAARPGPARQDRRRARSSSTGATCCSSPRRRCGSARQGDRDDLPGPDDHAQPGPHDRRADRARRSEIHMGLSQPGGPTSAPSSCSARSASRAPPSGWATTRTSSRAACASA